MKAILGSKHRQAIYFSLRITPDADYALEKQTSTDFPDRP